MYLQIVQRSLSPPADVQLMPQGYLDPTVLHTPPEAAREEQSFIILFRCYWTIIHYRLSVADKVIFGCSEHVTFYRECAFCLYDVHNL